MHRRFAIALVATSALASACTVTDGGEETRALTDDLAPIAADVNAPMYELELLLAAEYDNRQQLFQRIIDLRMPNRIAIQLDKAQRIEPPPGSDAELERYLTFIEEVLRASESLDLAVATEDPVATTIAAVAMEVSLGALAVDLPARSCAVLVRSIVRDLCEPEGLDGFEEGLSFELRRFVASFRPPFRIPDTFGDVIRGRVLGTLQADAALVLDAAAERIAALEPGPTYERLQRIVLAYFPAAADAWERFGADPESSDPLIYASIVESLEEQRLATREQLETEYELILAARPESQIAAIADVWFAEPDVATDE